MTFQQQVVKTFAPMLFVSVLGAQGAQAADRELLEILLQNNVITQEQFDRLVDKESLTTADILAPAPESVVVVREEELEVDFADTARVKVVKSMIISVRGKNEPSKKD